MKLKLIHTFFCHLDHDEEGEENGGAENQRKRKPAKVKKIGSFLRRIFGSSKSNLRQRSSAREADGGDGDDNGGDVTGEHLGEKNYDGEERAHEGEADTAEPYDPYDSFDEASADPSRLMLSGATPTTALLSRTYHGQTKHSERKRLDLYEHFTQYIDHYHRQEESSSEEEEEYEEENVSDEEEVEECATQIPLKYHPHQYHHQQYYEKPPSALNREEERRSSMRTTRTTTNNEHDFNNNSSTDTEHQQHSGSSNHFYYNNRHQQARSGNSNGSNHSSYTSRSNHSSKGSTATTASLPSEHFDEDLLQEFNRFEREFQSMNCPTSSS